MKKKLRVLSLFLSIVLLLNIVGVAAEGTISEEIQALEQMYKDKKSERIAKNEAAKHEHDELLKSIMPLKISDRSYKECEDIKKVHIAESENSKIMLLAENGEVGEKQNPSFEQGTSIFSVGKSIENKNSDDEISLLSVSSDTYSSLTRPSYINNIYAPATLDNSGDVSVSPFSGDVQINVTDIVLPGRNGLDLNLNHFYQSSHSDVEYGDKSSGYKVEPTTYYNERYALGIGWSFGFPSVEIRRDDNGVTQELYYHDGSGSTYRYNGDDESVETTSNGKPLVNGYQIYSTNLDNYYTDNAIFDKKDRSYNRDRKYCSEYSFKTADNTKQYFGKNGEILAIVDRFGNEIKFDYENYPGNNLIEFGSVVNFGGSSSYWTKESSTLIFNATTQKSSTSNSYKVPINEVYKDYKISFMYEKPTPARNEKPFDGSFNIAYQIYYNSTLLDTISIAEGISPEEFDAPYLFEENISVNFNDYDETPNKIRLVFEVVDGKGEIGFWNIRMSPMRPLISKITDTIGRTLEFNYDGDLYIDYETTAFPLTVTVKEPDGTVYQTITYSRNLYTYYNIVGDIEYEQRYFYFWGSYDEENSVMVEYGSGFDGYGRSDGYVYLTDDGYEFYSRPLVTEVDFGYYKTVINYEKTQKRIGDGFTDTWRVTSTYDINCSDDDYSKKYNSTSYNYTSGYYDDETAFNHAKSGINNLNSRYGKYVVKVNNSNGSIQQYEYTSHTFKKSGRLVRQIILPLVDKEIIYESDLGTDDSTAVSYTYNEKDLYAINSPDSATTIETVDGVSRTYINNYAYDDDSCMLAELTLNLTEEENNENKFPETKTTTIEYKHLNDRMFVPVAQTYYQKETGQLLSIRTEYDGLGRKISETDENGDIVYYEYDAIYPWQLSRIYYTDPMKTGDDSRVVETIYEYNDNYGFGPTSTKVKYADGEYAETYAEYEPQFGNIITFIDENGLKTEYTYDEFGRVNYIYSPSFESDTGNMWLIQRYNYLFFGRERTIMYDASLSDVPTEEIAYNYDGFGNLTEKCDYKKHENEKNIYDLSNRLIAYQNVVDYGTDNYTLYYSYDNLGRIISAKDKMGNIQKIAYKSLGKEFSFVPASATGEENHYTENYDIYGNLIETKTYPNDIDGEPVTQSFAYDLTGNLLSSTDGNGKTTTYKYDNIGNPVTVIFADGTKIETDFAKFGKPISVTRYDNGESYTIAKNYDDRGLEVSTEQKGIDIYARPWYYGYGEDAKLNSVNEPNGNRKSYTYDASGNLLGVSGGSESRSYAYNYLGLVTTAIKSVNNSVEQTVSYERGKNGEVQDKTVNGRQTSYYYNSLYSLTGYATPSYGTVSYTRDELDRVVEIEANSEKNFSCTYYDDGMVKDIIYPTGGIVTSYTYNNANLLESVVTKKGSDVIAEYNYTYDNAGNILSVSGNDNVTYTYDDLYRLESYTKDGTTVTYEYDGRNNIISESSTDGNSITYVYTGDNRLVTKTENGTATTYDYDLNGNLIGDSNGNRYMYDEDNKLVYSNVNGVETTYVNGLDECRISKIVDGVETTYDVDENGRVISENDNLIVVGGSPLAKELDDSYYYYIYNGHGDVVMMVDEDGNTVNSYSYDPWGKITEQTETVPNSIKYAGEYYDDETGLIYLRARYYDPGVRRFIQEDRHWNAANMIYGDDSNSKVPNTDAIMQASNGYVYCMDNPIKYFDFSGCLAYPGEIHNLVVDHIATKYGFYKEQTINYDFGWGRADLISEDGYVWDVKRDKTRQIESGKDQVAKYVANKWKGHEDVNLKTGYIIADDSFVVTINVDTYYVNYRYDSGGVIAYDYKKVTDWDKVIEYAVVAGVTIAEAILVIMTAGSYQPAYA